MNLYHVDNHDCVRMFVKMLNDNLMSTVEVKKQREKGELKKGEEKKRRKILSKRRRIGKRRKEE